MIVLNMDIDGVYTWCGCAAFCMVDVVDYVYVMHDLLCLCCVDYEYVYVCMVGVVNCLLYIVQVEMPLPKTDQLPQNGVRVVEVKIRRALNSL